MAHEFESGMFATTPAWHKLGTVVDGCQTSGEAIQKSGLDWTVGQWPLAAIGPDGSYRVYQNAEAFKFMDQIVGEKLALWETVGSLRGGRKVWMLAQLPGGFDVAPGDSQRKYILIANSHDGSSALQIFPTSVRVVCANTLRLALSGSDSFLSLHHRENLAERVQQAREKLGIALQRHDQFSEQARGLARKTLSREQMGEFFAGLLVDRSERQQKKLLEQFYNNLSHPSNDLPSIRGTAWQAYNAVSQYTDHQQSGRSRDQQVALERQVNSMWFGVGNELKQKAFADALGLAV